MVCGVSMARSRRQAGSGNHSRRGAPLPSSCRSAYSTSTCSPDASTTLLGNQQSAKPGSSLRTCRAISLAITAAEAGGTLWRALHKFVMHAKPALQLDLAAHVSILWPCRVSWTWAIPC